MSKYFGAQFLGFILGLALGSGAIAVPDSAIAQVSDLGSRSAQNGVAGALPDGVKQAVLQAAGAQTGIALDQLKIELAQPKIWSDGCLGLGPAGQMCTEVLVQGWQVRVVHGRQEWVYRTNASGQVVRFDPAGGRLSRLMPLVAEPIRTNPFSAKWDKTVLFRQIQSGGFAGRTQEVVLYKDGRVARQGNGANTVSWVGGTRQAAKQRLKSFVRQLDQLHFGQFNGLSYPPPSGAADYITVTLGNGKTTVQYVDLNLEDLPQDLQKIQALWRQLIGES